MKYIWNPYLLFFIGLLLVFCLIWWFFYNTGSPKQKKQGQYTAIIIEPREHPAMELVLSNFTKNLDNRWNFIIFHGKRNKKYIENLIDQKLPKEKSRIQLINLHIDNLSIMDYNNLLFTKSFYNYIPTEMFLIFQTDTLISEKYKNNIYDFMKYDYVGAPWDTTNIDIAKLQVGNGGLSLRRKSKMLEILNNCVPMGEPEDVFFALKCPNVKLNKPDYKTAMHFSVESIYCDSSFGLHKPWFGVSRREIEKMTENFPELMELIYLNHINFL